MKKKSSKGIPMSNMHDLDKLMGGSFGHGEELKAIPEAKHTPTPWYISREENGITTIRGDKANGRLFAVADTLKREDAEFIVRAVNSHEALLEAAKEAIACGSISARVEDLLGKAIAQAEGGK